MNQPHFNIKHTNATGNKHARLCWHHEIEKTHEHMTVQDPSVNRRTIPLALSHKCEKATWCCRKKHLFNSATLRVHGSSILSLEIRCSLTAQKTFTSFFQSFQSHLTVVISRWILLQLKALQLDLEFDVPLGIGCPG